MASCFSAKLEDSFFGLFIKFKLNLSHNFFIFSLSDEIKIVGFFLIFLHLRLRTQTLEGLLLAKYFCF